MKKALLSWKRFNPLTTHWLFDEDDQRELIEKNFDRRVLSAFDTLIPKAFKVDLWRLCALYVYGGIYVDADAVCLRSLPEIDTFPNDASMFALIDGNLDRISNAFIWCRSPKEPLIRAIIDSIVYDVESRRFSDQFLLHLTGPGKVTDVVKRHFGLPQNHRFRCGLLQTLWLGYYEISTNTYHIAQHDGNAFALHKSRGS